MKGGLGRVLTFGFLAFSLLFFFVYQPAAHRADYEQAVLTSVSAEMDKQNQIMAAGPQVDAADATLRKRLWSLRSKCGAQCSDVVATAYEVGAVRGIAKQHGVTIVTRTFNTDGTVDITTAPGSQAAALRFLDALQGLPAPIRLTRTTFTAEGSKVKIDLSGEIVSGAAL